MSAANPDQMAFRSSRPPLGVGILRRHTDLWLALAMGVVVGLLIFTLPMHAALATAVVGAFVLVMLVDTRVALFGLLLVRATIDVFATVPILNIESITPNALVSLLTIFLGIAHIATNRINLRSIPLVTPFALFVALTFVTLATTPVFTEGIEDWLRILSALLVYVMVVDLMRTEHERRWLLRILVLAAVVPVGIGMYQFFADAGNHDTPGLNRILATFVHPSPYAFFLVQTLPLVMLLFIHAQSRVARLGLGILLPVMLFSIYATQTRGAWIGAIVMVMVLMWYRARWSLVLVPLVLAAIVVASPSVRARIGSPTSGDCESVSYCESSVLWRTKQWEQVVRVPSPVELVTVGAGLRSVVVTAGEFSHNEYLRLLAETGVIGLTLTIIVYAGLFKIARRGYHEADTPYKRDLMLAFLMVLAARVIMSGADNVLVLTVLEWYFWAFAAVVVVESGAYKHSADTEDDQRRVPARSANVMPSQSGAPAP